MSKRKSMSKKLRFEVFKRDSFTCQYCGSQSPDVILHVDHIKPVAKGGANDLLNLITSCVDCNLGKGAREISDDTEVKKQKAQLLELNDRRLQFEELVRWREGIKDIDDEILDKTSVYWSAAAHQYELNESGLKSLATYIKKFGYVIVCDAIDTSTDTYLRYEDDEVTHDSIEIAFKKVGGIAYYMKFPEKKRDTKDAYYIRAVLRNRVSYVNDKVLMPMLRNIQSEGLSLDPLREYSKECSNWTDFREYMEEYYYGEEDDCEVVE